MNSTDEIRIGIRVLPTPLATKRLNVSGIFDLPVELGEGDRCGKGSRMELELLEQLVRGQLVTVQGRLERGESYGRQCLLC